MKLFLPSALVLGLVAPSVVHYDFTDGSVTKLPQIFFSDYGTDDPKDADHDPDLAEKIETFAATHGRQPDTYEIGDLVLGSGTLYLTAQVGSLVSDPSVKGLIYTHINRTDDVDTSLIVELGPEQGLKPDTNYEISAEVSFYSNAPTGGIGVGGAPDAVRYGLSVSLYPWSAEVLGEAPHAYYRTQTNGEWSINPFTDPSYAEIGSISNGIEQEQPHSNDFFLRTKSTQRNLSITTDANGRIYANLRTHSGYEGYSIWALKSLKVTAQEYSAK